MEQSINPIGIPNFIPAFPVTSGDIGRYVQISGYEGIYGGTSTGIVEQKFINQGISCGEIINNQDNDWHILYELKDSNRLYKLKFVKYDSLSKSEGFVVTEISFTDVRLYGKVGVNYVARIETIIYEPTKKPVKVISEMSYDLTVSENNVRFVASDNLLTVFSGEDFVWIIDVDNGKKKLYFSDRGREIVSDDEYYIDRFSVFPPFQKSKGGISIVSGSDEVITINQDIPDLLETLQAIFISTKHNVSLSEHSKRQSFVKLAKRSVPDLLNQAFSITIN